MVQWYRNRNVSSPFLVYQSPEISGVCVCVCMRVCLCDMDIQFATIHRL